MSDTQRSEESNQHKTPGTKPQLLSLEFMRGWPLPQPDEESDKEGRGRVLIVGGSRETPGAIVLAATACFRAGAGKVRMAAGKSFAPLVGCLMPESRVFSVTETKSGGLSATAAKVIAKQAEDAQAVLFGPGMIDERAVRRLLEELLPRIEGDKTLILDAGALTCGALNQKTMRALRCRTILTPHAEEMCTLLQIEKDELARDRLTIVRRAASELKSVVVLKGAETFIVGAEGEVYLNQTGNVGLATSGSGDVLSGLIAGLSARGASALQAAAWGVFLHGSAGDKLAARIGHLGFLARELLEEIPALMSQFAGD